MPQSQQAQSLRNKFFSLRSRSQSKLQPLAILKSNHHTRQSLIAKQIQEKIKQRQGQASQGQLAFRVQKQKAESQLLQLQIVQMNIKIQSLLKKLHTSFIHYKIPEFYSYFLFKRLKSVSREQLITDAVNREMNWMKEKQSHYQLIQPIVNARQGCLKQLALTSQSLKNSPSSQQVYRSLRQQIIHYRRLTALVIDHIRKWKQYLYQLQPSTVHLFTQHPVYIHGEQDYFITLLNDNMFIFNSFLSSYVKFSDKNDPFMIRPYVETAKQQKYKDLFALAQNQRDQYMGMLSYLADQRAKYLKKKVWLKEEKIRNIEKIYQSKGDHLRNSIFLSKSNLNDQNLSKSNIKGYPLEKSNLLKAQIDFIDSSHQSKRQELDLKQKKFQTLRRIKQTLNSTGSIFSKNKLQMIKQNSYKEKSDNILGTTLLSDKSPIKLKFPPKQTYQQEDEDFGRMMRRKEVEILQQANDLKQLSKRSHSMYSSQLSLKRNNSHKSVRIKDSLSNFRNPLNNKSTLNQLQQIVESLQKKNPLQLSQFKMIGKSVQQTQQFILSPKKLKSLSGTKSLLQHNEQVIFELRSSILKEIKEEKINKEKLEIVRKMQNQRVQEILEEKLQKQVLKHVNQEKAKRVDGRDQFLKDVRGQALFGSSVNEYEKSKQNSRKLTELQQELKKEFQLRMLREVHEQLKRKTALSDIQLQKMRQQEVLDKETQKLMEKQQRERRYKEIQLEERAKSMRSMIELQEHRKRQIEEEMQQAIKQEKQRLEKFSLQTRLQLQSEMKQQMKEKLLMELKKETEDYYDNKLSQEELKVKEDQYREEVRRRLEKEYNVEEILQRQSEREDKDRKRKLLQDKFEQFDNKLGFDGNKSRVNSIGGSNAKGDLRNGIREIVNVSNSDKSPLVVSTHLHQSIPLEQAKQYLIQKQELSPPKKSQTQRKLQESHKLKLREQFEVELFAFMRPQNTDLSNTEIIKKDIKAKLEIDSLNKREEQLKREIQQIGQQVTRAKEEQKVPKNQKGLMEDEIEFRMSKQMKKIFNKDDIESDKFQRYSQINDTHNNNITNLNKKSQANKTSLNLSPQKSFKSQLSPEQQLVRIKLQMTKQEFQIYIKKKEKMNKIRTLEQEQKKKLEKKQEREIKKKLDQFQLLEFDRNETEHSDIDNKNPDVINSHQISIHHQQGSDTSSILKQTKHISPSKKLDLVQSPNKKSHQMKQLKQQPYQKDRQSQDSEVMKLTVHSHVSDDGFKRNVKFMTSESQQDENSIRRQSRRKTSKKQPIKQKSPNKPSKQRLIDLDSISQPQQHPHSPQRNPYQPPSKPFVKPRLIPTTHLQTFMKQHFEHLPKLIKKLNLYKRDELVKILREDFKEFFLLECIQNDISLGIVVCALNEAKMNMRSFIILHLGPYQKADAMALIKTTSEYLFQHDPLEQACLSLFYYLDQPQQLQFMKQLQKQFSSYGAMFQKKIFNTQFERKLILRRQLGVHGVKLKEKTNCGQFWVRSELIVTQKFLGVHRPELQVAGQTIGSYGLVGVYLAGKVIQERLKQIIGMERLDPSKSDDIDSKSCLTLKKHLAKQCLSFQPQLQKLTPSQSYQLKSFPSPFQLNLYLHSQSLPLVPVSSTLQQQPNTCDYTKLSLSLQLAYPFTTQKNRYYHDDTQYQSDYFRFTMPSNINNIEKSKRKTAYELKSKLYSEKMIVMACKNQRYKMFVMGAGEYDVIRKINNLPKGKKANDKSIVGKVNDRTNLDVYVKLFLANLSSHSTASFQSLWLPQFKSQRDYICQQLTEPFVPSSSQSLLKTQLNYYHTSYLQNSLIYQTSHRDLIITPPFILGVIDAQMNLVTQGATVVVKRFGIQDMVNVKQVQKIIDQD